jgi:acyl-CoA synthetase (NDP forming)/RimJ/RimL family protein N-acetyltransferase
MGTEGPPPVGRDPQRWSADVALSDGGTVHVRPVRPDDAPLVREFHSRQSPESIYYRYFTARPELSDRELEHLTVVDYRDRLAFVALLGDDLVGIARYDRWPGRNEAEVAFFVDDGHQRRGIGILLLEYLAAAGREQGFERFTAQVLPTNRKMISVFQQVGFEVTSKFEDGVIEVSLGIEPTEEARERIEARARASEARSVARLLAPASVAVIGSGRTEGTFGHEVVRQLVAHEFQGPVYPVHREATHVAGLPAFASVLDIPDQVGLAVIAVPADQVPSVVDDCARRRVQALAVVSAGFSDQGDTGRAVEKELVRTAHRNGMRLLGPHSLGLVNTDPEISLHAIPVPGGPPAGPIGFLTQSGTLGVAVLDRFADDGLGISSFVSVGNKADVSANDLLRYWETDERTHVVAMYVESLGNPRTFSRVARQVSQSKPVVVLRAASRVLATDELLTSTVLEQAGVIEAHTLEHLLDVVRLLVTSPLPQGDRVAVVTSSGTPAALAAEACLRNGLTLAGPPERLTHEAGPAEYEAAVQRRLPDPDVDSVLVVLAPPAVGGQGRPGRPLPDLAGITSASTGAKPVVVAFLAAPDHVRQVAGMGVPAFGEPDDAARALAAATRYARFLAEPRGDRPVLEDVDPEAATEVVTEVLGREQAGPLGPDRAQRLLSAFGIEPVHRRLAFSVGDAVEAAGLLGYPVALKATGLERLRQTESGGVALDLPDGEAVAGAYERMVGLLGEAMHPAVVQKMLPGGVDVVVRLRQDPTSGSVVACGLGGAVTGVVPEPQRALPLTDADATRLVASSAVAALLAELDPTGAATARVEDVVLRLAALGEALPEVAEVVLNPVIVSATGIGVADAAVRVAPYGPDGLPEVRRL